MASTTSNTITDVPPAQRDTPYSSRRMINPLHDQLPGQRIGRCRPHDWPAQSPDLTPPRVSCMRLHEKHSELTHRRGNYDTEFSMLQEAKMTLMFYVRFKSPRIWNTHRYITAENRTYIHMTLLAENYPSNKTPAHWHRRRTLQRTIWKLIYYKHDHNEYRFGSVARYSSLGNVTNKTMQYQFSERTRPT
jgi:hypothetical protein